MHFRPSFPAAIAPRFHGGRQIIGAAESGNEERHKKGHHPFGFLPQIPAGKSAPREDWAFMIRSVSSSSVGMKRSAMVIIIASSWAGTPKRRNGFKSASIPSVRTIGLVVYVRSEEKPIRNTRRSVIKRPFRRPSSLIWINP